MTKIPHPLFARSTPPEPGVERKGGAEHRAELLAGVAGRVVELGAGNGLDFARYPPAVTGVVAVEPEPYLRERAAEAAAAAPGPVRVVDDSGLWPRLSGGRHAGRDTTAAIEAAGFAIERCRRFAFAAGPVSLTDVIGLARRR